MGRFFADPRGRVVDRETRRYLGRVEAAKASDFGDVLYWPLDWDGMEVRRPTMVKSIAILAVVRAALPRESVTLLDVEDNGVA